MAENSERGTRSSRGRSQGGRGGDNGSDDRRRGGYSRKPKVCAFCADKQLEIDYKQPDMLWRHLTSRGKIRPRRQTGSCARHQRQLAIAIKRARHLALLPFVAEYPRSS